MAQPWEPWLERWKNAGLVDEATAARIRDYEAQQPAGASQNWASRLALVLGAIAFSGGIFLFISARWEALSPADRVVLFGVLTVVLHGLGVASRRLPRVTLTLHALGTIALSCTLGLYAEAHKEIDSMAVVRVWLVLVIATAYWLRDWLHGVVLAIAVPAYLMFEWHEAFPKMAADPVFASSWLLLLMTYATAPSTQSGRALDRALISIGSALLIPAAAYHFSAWQHGGQMPATASEFALWAIFLGGPLAIAAAFRPAHWWVYPVAAAWLVVSGFFEHEHATLLLQIWLMVGSIGYAVWGMWERREERLNLGIIGFALTTGSFLFTNLNDRLGRSVSLILLGTLFIAGGWKLEQLRRRWVQWIRDRHAPAPSPGA